MLKKVSKDLKYRLGVAYIKFDFACQYKIYLIWFYLHMHILSL